MLSGSSRDIPPLVVPEACRHTGPRRRGIQQTWRTLLNQPSTDHTRAERHADWVERDRTRIWHGFTQMSTFAENAPIIVERAEGRELIDVDGWRYLDAISSLWVTTLGHNLPELNEAIVDQLGRVSHTTMLGHGNKATIELAEALTPRVPVADPRFLFASDGAAAVEQALKIAFQYWVNQGVEGRDTYLSFGGAYHGDTIGSVSVGADGFGTDIFNPLRFDVVRAPGFDDPACMTEAVRMIAEHRDSLAAVVVEPLVQGAAGIQVLGAEHFLPLAAACREHDVLLLVDEVATGFGRTGTLFASDQIRSLGEFAPDLMAIGKGLTGGYLPMSATVAAGHVANAFLGPDLGPNTLYHGHSFSGNAASAAAALAHLRLFDEWDVLSQVQIAAAHMADALAAQVVALPQVRQVRQCGLMVGIELAPPADGLLWGRKTAKSCVQQGVLVRPLGDVIVLMPILTSTSDEIERMVAATSAAIAQLG